jgi:ribosomal protein S4
MVLKQGVANLKRDELRNILRERNLSISGAKSDLILRLEDVLRAEGRNPDEEEFDLPDDDNEQDPEPVNGTEGDKNKKPPIIKTESEDVTNGQKDPKQEQTATGESQGANSSFQVLMDMMAAQTKQIIASLKEEQALMEKRQTQQIATLEDRLRKDVQDSGFGSQSQSF